MALPAAYGLVPRTSELSPLWIFPAHPALRELSEWLFANLESLLSPRSNFERIDTPLLTVPTYRLALISALQDGLSAALATRYSDRTLLVTDRNTAWFAYAQPDDTESILARQLFA